MLGMFRHRDPATGYIKRRSPTCGASPDDQQQQQQQHLDHAEKPRARTSTTTTTTTTTTSSTTASSSSLLSSSSSSSRPDDSDSATMAAVDVFFLTFNCAKNLVDVPVFATHLLAALSQRAAAASLPDLVAL